MRKISLEIHIKIEKSLIETLEVPFLNGIITCDEILRDDRTITNTVKDIILLRNKSH